MTINLSYNQKTVAVEIAPEHLGAVLELNEKEGNSRKNPVECAKEAVRGSFEAFMELPGSLLVIVNDGTRPTPTRFILDAIGKQLDKAKASFLVATGSHRAPTEKEYGFIFGSWWRCGDVQVSENPRNMAAYQDHLDHVKDARKY